MSEKIRVGIVGANPNGSWGTFAHLPALAALPQFEATAVATAHLESAQQTATKFGLKHAFDDPRQLAECADVDVVAVCVRVPKHLELVSAALDAGKHVYCEWPLGRTTAEAETMLKAAQGKRVVHMVGLQARHSPVLTYAKHLIESGSIGEVQSCLLNHSVDWISHPGPAHAYLNDIYTGAHMLSIPGGHSIDALCWLLGEFAELSATLKTLNKTLDIAGTGETMTRTSPDQILVSGVLTSGAVAAVRIAGATSPGTGVRLEINGSKGDLVISGAPGGRGIQMTDLRLQQTRGMAELADVAIPESYYHVPASIRSGPPLNVAHGYVHLAKVLAGQAESAPDFATALQRHRTLDAVQAAAKSGQRLTFP